MLTTTITETRWPEPIPERQQVTQMTANDDPPVMVYQTAEIRLETREQVTATTSATSYNESDTVGRAWSFGLVWGGVFVVALTIGGLKDNFAWGGKQLQNLRTNLQGSPRLDPNCEGCTDGGERY